LGGFDDDLREEEEEEEELEPEEEEEEECAEKCETEKKQRFCVRKTWAHT
jgi:hypothetical protein